MPEVDVLADEYGSMDARGETYTVPILNLENGHTLKNVDIRYRTYGKLNEDRSNAIIVCHALTGNASIEEWWPGLLGNGAPLNTQNYFVICANVLGSPYGTCSPISINPDTGKSYAGDFPLVTVRDSVNLHRFLLRDHLRVNSIACAIGGSMGGMQVLEWVLINDPEVRSGIILSAGGRHTPWQIGISELQRQAIYADPNYKNGFYDMKNAPNAGLSVARQIAMVSYRTHNSYSTKFGRRFQQVDQQRGELTRGGSPFEVESYLRHQGTKFLKRNFDANSYIVLTQLMDSHDISRGREKKYLEILNSIRIPMLVIGISSDVLYPVTEQKELAEHLANCQLHIIPSDEGHDGFLLEQARVGPIMTQFLHANSFRENMSRLISENREIKGKLEKLNQLLKQKSVQFSKL